MTQNPDATTPAPPRSALDDFFGRLRSSGFHRDTERRWFGGVCAGLADKWRVDPLLIRAAAVVLAFIGGLGLTAYLVLWLLLPDRRGDLLLERALRRGDGWPVVLLVITAFVLVGGIVSIGQGNSWGGPLWVLVPVALVVWFIVDRGRSSGAAPTDPPRPAADAAGPPPTGGTTMSAPTPAYAPGSTPGAPPPRYGYPPEPGSTSPRYGYPTDSRGTPPPGAPPRPVAPPPPPGPRRRRPSGFVGLISLGLALALFGVGVALDGPLGFPGVPAVLGFGLALAGVSVVALALGLSGRAGGFTSVLVIVLGFALLTTAGASRINVTDGVGERTWRPVASGTPVSYDLGAGDATLDLNRLGDDVASGPTNVSVHLGAGDLTILVPDDVTARVDAHVGIGDIQVRGTGPGSGLEQSGADRSLTTTVGGDSAGDTIDVVVTADVGLGQITIQEQ
jgi:phage shock protein PspC (stress-responsive transcriptional regulator)